jgi:hypothetical protein
MLTVTADGEQRVDEARPLWLKAQAELASEFGDERTTALLGELNALAGARQ